MKYVHHVCSMTVHHDILQLVALIAWARGKKKWWERTSEEEMMGTMMNGKGQYDIVEQNIFDIQLDRYHHQAARSIQKLVPPYRIMIMMYRIIWIQMQRLFMKMV